MASTLTLDRSDPGVNDLVSQWKDGETYTVELTIVQSKSSPNAASYDVVGIADMGEGPGEEEEVTTPPPKAKPEMAVKY